MFKRRIFEGGVDMFKKISPEDIENVIKRIGKDWMLICAYEEMYKES